MKRYLKRLVILELGFCMGDEKVKNSYINSVSDKILRQDKTNLMGWIVDLRGNFGGDMGPMLIAIGPILGEGTLGYFFYPDNSLYTWKYKDGTAYDENYIWGKKNL